MKGKDMSEDVQPPDAPTLDEASRKWTDWAAANYPGGIAERVSEAAIDAIKSGGSHEAAYAAAIREAEAHLQPAWTNAGATRDEPAQPLVSESDHARGTVGLSADGGNLVVRTHGKNPLTRKEWQKEEAKALALIGRILVVSRDRVTFGFEVYDGGDKTLFRIDGCSSKESLDVTMHAIAERAPHIRIELAHPSHGIPDPFPDEVKTQRKTAEAFNRQEQGARENSMRQLVKIKNYDNGKDYARDANSMAKAGWMPQGESAGRGKVSVGGTAGKLVLTAGLGAITGMSRKGSKMTVTWVKQLPYHEPRVFMIVPGIPEARTFPHEPYFTATNLARMQAGDEYPAAGATDAQPVSAGQAPGRTMPRTGDADAPYSLPVKTRPQQVIAQDAGVAPPRSAGQPSVAVRLKDLAELHDAGLITDEEFAAKRSALIAEL
jgi:hypothetical protein